MEKLNTVQLSSLEKVFIGDTIFKPDYNYASVLKGEDFSYQIAYCCEGTDKLDIKISVQSPILDCITVRKVVNVPSGFSAYKNAHDKYYIKTEPGLFPDLLEEISNNDLDATAFYNSLWVNIKTSQDIEAGIYPITIELKDDKGSIKETKTFKLEVINAFLPRQELLFTQWFHCDCIASHYNVPVFSEQHWDLIDKFVKTAVSGGINMILTPVFTPPLDTKVGEERPTVQLVDISREDLKYTFEFDKLKRWVDMCRKNGIEYFEMPHLFTQWGAKFTPKIMAYENNSLCRIFGWDVEAISDSYNNFLKQFLPALVDFLKKEGLERNTYFHISDEPTKEHIKTYSAARKMVDDMLKDFVIFDALTHYEFYENNLISTPVVANDHIEPFIEKQVPNLWTYNCCAQSVDVGNRFMSMPSYRNRILGIQMYKHNIKGFLHWGYNFYYSQWSKQLINPFVTTDALGAFPSGDSFSVYPGIEGPLESLRFIVFKHGLQDMQALRYLENIMPKEDILSLIDSEKEVSFSSYPQNPDYIISLREKVNKIIANSVK